LTTSSLPQRLEAPRREIGASAATEEALDRLVRLAARTLRAPVAYLTLVDEGRQTVRNLFGTDLSVSPLRDLPLEKLLTAEVIAQGGPLSVDDLSARELAPALAPIADGAAALLAFPLRLESGHAIGVLGVIDYETRAWSAQETEILGEMADAILAEIRSVSHGLRSTTQALRDSEDRFRSLIENAADAVTVVSAGGMIDYATPSVERVLGYSPEELTGQNAFALLHPSDAPVVIGQFSRLVRGAECEGTTDCRVRHKDGSWRNLEVRVNNLLHDSAVMGVVVNARDITDARQAKDTQRRLQTFLEATPDFVATFDPHGRALSVNAAFRTLAGIKDGDDLSTLTIADLFPPSVTELILHQGIPEAVRSGLWSGEMVLESLEGARIDVSQVIIAHKAADGSLEFLSTLARDITERKRAEHEIVEQRAFYEQILENIDVDIAVFDAEGRYEYVNQNAVRDPEVRRAMIGRNDFEYAALRGRSPEIAQRRVQQLQTAIASRSTTEFEEQLTAPAGETRYFIRKHLPILDREGKVTRLIGYGFDITERRRAEEERRRSVELLRDAERIAHMGSWEWDVTTGDLIWSDEMYRVFGMEPGEPATFERFIGAVHPDDRSLLQETVERALTTHEPYFVDHRVVRPDGTVAHVHGRGHTIVDAEGIAVRMMGSGQDVTERRSAEEALRQSEQDYRGLFENAHDGIVLMAPDGERVLDVNPRACEMYGYAREEFIGMSMESVSMDVEAGRQKVQRTLEMGSAWSFEIIQRRKDGSPLWVEVTAAMVDYKGMPAILSVSRDVSARHAAEEALRESQEQLVQAQKMDAVGRLAGGIAHDFNNLLTAIKGFTELLLLDFDEGDPRHPFVTEIQGAANRAAALTRQLLAFSRKQVLQPRVLDLNASVTDIEKMLRRLLGEDIQLETRQGRDLGRVKADPSQVEQVLVNLAVNARDAMPSGGTIVVRTENVDLTREQIPTHSNVGPGPYVLLAVSDNGSGMGPEVQARIFEPFFTTKEKGKGTGLGLSTVYGIVQQSGGFVQVESVLGEGTTFLVYLPRVHEEAETSVEKVADRRPVTGSETVLLVEDEAAVRVLVRRVLDRNGYRVLEAGSGMDALQLLQSHSEPIHLLLTDVVMPGMSGRELADRLAPEYPEMHILYMSGYTDEAIVHHGVLDAGIALIEKPFTPEVLLRQVREILDSRVGAGT
jgi:two-component system cell cycle sensor histidine kinase/response regulator CckA